MEEQNDAIELERKSVKPLYSQIYDHIYKQIIDGELQPGDQLPAELDLAKQYEVGRVTIRRAIAELVQEGFLGRQAGKGTFVAPRKIERELVNVTSFTERMNAIGMHARSEMISSEVIPVNASIAAELMIAPETPVLLLTRLRYSDDVPVSLERAYISLKRCPGLEDLSLENVSLYQILKDNYNLLPIRSRKTLEITTSTDWESRFLQILTRTPLFLLRATVYADDGPFEYVKNLMRGDKFRFQI